MTFLVVMAIRIGILLTHPKQERNKSELLECLDAKMEDCPWKDAVPKQFAFPRKASDAKELGKCGVPTDVAIGSCIKHACQNQGVEVDFILPDEVSLARLRSNDLNFLLIYDLLEAFHTDKTDRRSLYKAMRSTLQKADNIYPPLKYQEFVYSKINYYNYMKINDIPIVPTITMTAEEHKRLGNKAAVQTVVDQVNKEGWGKFIAKPVYGQEGKDLKFFEPNEQKDVEGYLEEAMKKYPGIVFQKCIKHFGNTLKCPELRLYFTDDEYKYSICSDGTNIHTPKEEGGRMQLPLEKLKREARGILKKLPPLVMPNGVRLPRLITRVDMGFKIDGEYRPFVNEVEFVPSIYAEGCSSAVRRAHFKTVSKYIRETAAQMVKVTRLYAKRRGLKRPLFLKKRAVAGTKRLR